MTNPVTILIKRPGETEQLVEGFIPTLANEQEIVGGPIQILPQAATGLPVGVFCNEMTKVLPRVEWPEPSIKLLWQGEVVLGAVFFAGSDSKGEARSLTADEIIECVTYCQKNGL